MPSFKDRVEIENVKIIRQTAKAILCRIDDREIWIPQSQVDDDSDIWAEGEEGTLTVSEWIAREKKLI